MTSMNRRIGKLEAMLETAASKAVTPREMTDRDLWVVILEQASIPATPENIAFHERYNENHPDAVWVQIDGRWVDSLATAQRRPSREKGNSHVEH